MKPSIEKQIILQVKAGAMNGASLDNLRKLIADHTAQELGNVRDQAVYFHLLQTIFKFNTKEEIKNILDEVYYPWRFDKEASMISNMNYLFMKHLVNMPVSKYDSDEAVK